MCHIKNVLIYVRFEFLNNLYLKTWKILRSLTSYTVITFKKLSINNISLNYGIGWNVIHIVIHFYRNNSAVEDI